MEKHKLIGCLICLLIIITPLVLVNSDLISFSQQSTSGQPEIGWNNINWVLVDEDNDESGGENWRDVLAAYAAYDSGYLYLKLETVEPPKFPTSKNDRDDDKYRWFLDFDGNMYWQGNVLYEAEYLLSVQDKNDDGIGEMYILFDSDNDSEFNDERWEPIVVNSTDGGFRIFGNQLEIYIRWSKVGGMPSVLWLSWCTDRSDQNLNQCPSIDRAETAYGVVIQLGSIRGYKWEDLNRDGSWNNEPPIPEWEIHLQSGSMFWKAYTGNDGFYQFIALPEGTYTVGETIPHGWTQTYPGNNSYIVQISSGQQFTGKDFGNFKIMASLSIRKTANVTIAHVGEDVEYSYNVTNIGNVPITIEYIYDNVTGIITVNQLLEPSQWIVVNAPYTVKECDPDPLVNTATVNATYNDWKIYACDTWTLDILRPKIMIKKVANVSQAYVGDTIEYTINVTNIGDCTLHNVKVSDSLFSDLLTNGFLGPDRSLIFTRTYTVDVEGRLVNIANASGMDSLGMCVYDEDSWVVSVSYPPQQTANVTFNATGLGSDASENVVLTVDGTSYTYGQLPISFEWPVGSLHTFAWSSPIEIGSDKRYAWISTIGLSELQAGEINVPAGGGRVTSRYKTQYFLIMSTNYGTVNPGSGWYDASSVVEISATAPSAVDGERYDWLGWVGTGEGSYTGLDNPAQVTMNGPISETAFWRHEYYLSVTSPYDAPNPTSGWFEAGTEITAYVTSPWPVDAVGNRYVCTGWTGTGSVPSSGTETSVTFTINEPSSITWNWKTQYLLMVKTDPESLTPQPIRNPVGEEGPISSWWYDASTSITLTAQHVEGYKFSQWSVNGIDQGSEVNPIAVVMDAPKTAIAHYSEVPTVANVTFAVKGLKGDYAGTVLTVDGTKYSLANLPITFTWSIGSNHTFEFDSPLIVSFNEKRYIWTNTSGLSTLQKGTITVPNEGGKVEASYKTQYYLKIQSNYGVTDGEGWYDEGTTAYARLNTGLIGTDGSRHVFIKWSADASGTNYVQSNPIIMDAPKTATAIWKTQHYLTVISPYDTPGGMGWYDEGAIAYATLVHGTQEIAPGKKAAFTSWSGDASGTALKSNPITMDKPKTAIALWTIQWYLSVKVDPPGIGTIQGEGWYSDSTKVSLEAPLYLPSEDGVNGVRYKFSYWDVDGAIISGNPITVHMNAPHTATAHYIKQYEVVFSQVGLDATATGTIVTVNGASKDYNALPYKLWMNEGHTVSYAYMDIVSSVITGKRFKLESISGPASPIIITSPTMVAGIYTAQYYLIVNTNPTEVLTINPSAVSGEGWYNSGSTAIVDAVQTVEKIPEASKYEFKYWTDATSTGIGNQATVYMDSPKTVTANYILQHKITFSQTGVSSDFKGSIVEVDDVSYGFAELAKSFWWDEGSTHEFKFQFPLNVNTIKQFVWTSTSGLAFEQSAKLTVTGPGEIIGNYKTQWLQIFKASDNVKEDSIGSIVTVNGKPVSAGGLPYELWADEGITINYDYEKEVSSGLTGKRYRLISVSGPPSGYRVSSSNSIFGNYTTQYYLNVISPYDSPAPESGWFDAGTSITASVTSPWPIEPVDTCHICLGWTGTGSVPSSGTETSVTFTINEPSSITWNWKTQYLVTFTQAGSRVPSTVIYQVNSGLAAAETVPFSIWVDAGSQISYSYPETISEIAGTRYVLISISPASPQIVNASLTVIGNYKTQHYLDVVSPYGSPGGMGWYDEGAMARATLAHGREEIPFNVRSIFIRWNGDASGTDIVSKPIIMDAPKTAIAKWKTQFYLMLNTNPEGVATPSGKGWYDADTYAYISTPQYVNVTIGTRYRFSGWTTSDMSEIVDPNAPVTGILMDKAKTVTANYVMQYYLEVNVEPPDSAVVPGEGWYDEGTQIVIIAPEYWPLTEGIRLRFDHWTIDETVVFDNQLNVYMNKPRSTTAHYAIQYSVTFSQTGLDAYAEGKVVEVNGSEKTVSDLPFTIWVDSETTINYTYEATVSSSLPSARYSLESVTGPASPLAVTQPVTIVGNYEATYYLEVISEFGNPYGSGWYRRGSAATFGVATPVDHGNGTIRVFLKWFGDAEIYEPEGTMIVIKPSTVTAAWQTMYLVTFNTTLPNNVVLSIPNVPSTLPPGMNIYGAYYPAGEHVTVGPAPKTVMENERTRYAFQYWTLYGKPFTDRENLSFIVDQPYAFAVAYDIEHLLVINAKGVQEPFKATVIIATSPSTNYELSPTSPIQQWIRQGTKVTLTISTPNKIGHGEWAIFKEWSKDISEIGRTASFTMLNSMVIDAVFFQVNPVALSIPYSILAGLIMMFLCAVIAREGKSKEKNGNRRAATSGVIVAAVSIIIAAIISSIIAMGYGINPAELVDLTNWAVVFLIIEAIVFMVISAIVVRKVQRTKKTEENKA